MEIVSAAEWRRHRNEPSKIRITLRPKIIATSSVPKSIITASPIGGTRRREARALDPFRNHRSMRSDLAVLKLSLPAPCRDNGWLTFISSTGGMAVDIATVRERFFESAVHSGVHPDRASAIWEPRYGVIPVHGM